MIIEINYNNRIEATGNYRSKKNGLKGLGSTFLRKIKCREEKKGKGKQESSDIRKENEKGIEEEHHYKNLLVFGTQC